MKWTVAAIRCLRTKPLKKATEEIAMLDDLVARSKQTSSSTSTKQP